MSGIRTIIVRFHELPKPIKLSTYLYLGSILMYNSAAAYVDSKDAIEMFKAGKLTREPNVINGAPITTKWEAAKYGAKKNFCSNLRDAIIWPITTVSNIVPLIAVGLN